MEYQENIEMRRVLFFFQFFTKLIDFYINKIYIRFVFINFFFEISKHETPQRKRERERERGDWNVLKRDADKENGGRCVEKERGKEGERPRDFRMTAYRVGRKSARISLFNPLSNRYPALSTHAT